MRRKKRELIRLKTELRDIKDPAKRQEYKKKKRDKNQEVFRLKKELHADGELTQGASETGALPDFVIIGVKKCGTTTLYRLLTQHPYVQPAALKEPHYFIHHYDEGVEWYRRCFPAPRWKDGRRTITGEATPKYLLHPLVPERMEAVIPDARLIALLRNPVDRAYSGYQQMVRKGLEHRTFEEAIDAEKARPSGEDQIENEEHAGPDDDTPHHEYLARGMYVDQLLRWSEYFEDEQMLVLKSEDFFERPSQNLERILTFLDLPSWEPEVYEVRKQGRYEQGMDPETRRHLEEFFEPHNRRLYEHLGVDFGW
jgi:hypothetical protein